MRFEQNSIILHEIKEMYKYLLIILGFIPLGFVHAQALVGGLVKNAETLEPIRYASVRLDNSMQGTSTDENGRFVLEVPNYNASNSFTVQLVGYRSQTIGLVELMKKEVIFLEVDEQEIGEVLIQPKNAYELVQEVLLKVPDNYYANPIAQEVFYRQSLLTNGDLALLEEGRFNILNNFHRKQIPGNVVVEKARGFIDLSVYDALGKIVAKNLEDDSVSVAETAETLLAFNPDLATLQADKQGVFGENAFKNYTFTYMGIAMKGGHTLYMVGFDQKEDLKKTLYKGVMFIDTASMAVAEIEVGLSPQGLDLQKLLPLKYRLLAKIAGFSIYIENVSFTAKYIMLDDFWLIDRGMFILKGSVSRRKGEVLNSVLQLDFKVLDNYSKTAYYNIPSSYNVLPSSLEEFKEDDFWQGENHLPISSAVEEALKNKLIDQ